MRASAPGTVVAGLDPRANVDRGDSFDENGNFVYMPFSNLSQITECFRRRVIKLFNIGF